MELVLRHPRRARGGEEVDEFDIKHPLLELRLTSEKKGLGLFATKEIKRSTCLLSETHLLLVVPQTGTVSYQELHQQLEKLSTGERDVLYGLQHNPKLLRPRSKAQIRDYAVAIGKLRKNNAGLEQYVEDQVKAKAIFETNATNLVNKPGLAIFPLYSRINHSCTPNLHASYNPILATHTVHTVRDIHPGEEILTTYIDPAQHISDRKEALLKRGVKCHCPRCQECIEADHAPPSNTRRMQICSLKLRLYAYDGDMVRAPDFPPFLIPKTPGDALDKALDLIKVLLQEGLVGMELAAAYRWASKFHLQLGILEKAIAFAKLEAEVELYCLGSQTEYLSENAEAWMGRVRRTAEKDGVRMRMCEKRMQKENKRLEKKAEKKAKKR